MKTETVHGILLAECERQHAMIRPTFCAVYREANLERCKKCHQAAEMDALAAGMPEEERMPKKRVKVVAPCRACGREMEIAGRGLCGRCYGRVTRAINSGLTEAEAEEKLMKFLEEISEVAGDGTGEALPEISEREPVTEERIDGWGVEPVGSKDETGTEATIPLTPDPEIIRHLERLGGDDVLAAECWTVATMDTKPRPMVRPPSRQEWLMMRCEDLARSIHRVLERRLEGVDDDQEMSDAADWLLELATHFDQIGGRNG